MGPSKPMPGRDIIAIDVGRDEGGFCPTGCVWGESISCLGRMTVA